MRNDRLETITIIAFMFLVGMTMTVCVQQTLIKELHKAIELRDKTIHTLDSIIINHPYYETLPIQ